MPSWSRISMNFDKNLDHEEIDEFLEHLSASVGRRLQRLGEEYKTLSEDQFEYPNDIHPYRDHLTEQMMSSQAAKELGDELSIVALYKKVEAQTGRVIKRRVPAAASKKLAYFTQLCEALPFDIKTVNGFVSFNELRLLNNSIKHGGVVSQELADSFPSWAAGAEPKELGSAFSRLLPGVKSYVSDLVEKVYAHTKPSTGC